MGKKKTHGEYVEEVKKINPNIEVVGIYINNNISILHKCAIHNVEWNAYPGNILKGCGCKQCANDLLKKKKSKTHEQYVEDLKNINSKIIVLDRYVNAHTPLLHKCLIDEYEWKVKPNNILSGTGCPKCANNIRKTHEEYVNKITSINPYIEVLEEYINACTPILHKCKKHNIQWNAIPDNVLKGKGCFECKAEKIILAKRKTHDIYVEEVHDNNPNIFVLGEYINSDIPIEHKCLIDGYRWKASPANILSGTGCPKCANNIRKTHEEYVNEISEINSDIEVIGKYVNSHTPILHRCLIDNNEWYAKPTNIILGHGCPQCRESSGERRIRQWLQKHNIKYIFQQPFNDCRDTLPLPFDFYLPDYNLCIEYDDRQHFEPIEFFGGQEKFELQVKHDNIKNEYCKNSGISLLRIPYFKNVEEELNNFLFI